MGKEDTGSCGKHGTTSFFVFFFIEFFSLVCRREKRGAGENTVIPTVINVHEQYQ